MTLCLVLLCVLCSPGAHAEGPDIWTKGRWEKDGAVNIFNLLTVRKDGTIAIAAEFEGLEGDFVHDLSRPHAGNALGRGEPPMDLTGAEVDGRPAKAFISRDKDGAAVSVKIPSPGPGRHTYRLHLRTRNRILFGNKEFDELTWETGSAFGTAGIARVSCSIILPEGASLRKQSAWLGRSPGQSGPVRFWKGKSGSALYRGETYMRPGESFTVSLQWNKGIVTPPGIWDPGQAGGSGSCDIHNSVTVEKDGAILIEARYKGYKGHFSHSLNRIYSSSTNFIEKTPVEFVSATVDGRPAQASLTMNGDEPSTVQIIPPSEGPHDYVLHLKTADCILFGDKEYDEFTWDLGAAGRTARVSCDIRLPEGAAVLEQKARLGHETTGHKKVTMWHDEPNEARYRGEGYMEVGESFAVTVRFSKGAVTPSPSARRMARLEWSAWVLCAVVALFCTGVWWRYGKDPWPGTAVPRFTPPVLPDGNLLSPAGVAYVRDAARLKSRGFVGLLLNLAVQKSLSIRGSGTRKDPYVLAPGGKGGPGAVLPPKAGAAFASDGDLSGRWNAAIRRGGGFDEAERAVIGILSAVGEQRIWGRQSTWSLAVARGEAYLELSEALRGCWRLRAGVVLAMHLAVYAAIVAFLGMSGVLAGNGWAAVCAIVSLSGLMAWLYHATLRKVHRFIIQWQEMGWLTMAAFLLLCALVPVILLYDCLVIPDADLADFAGRDLMAAWQAVRLLLVPALMGLLYKRTRNLVAITVGPLKFLGFVLGFFLIMGTMWAFNFPGTSSLALLLTILAPTAFLPIMKQPSPDALKLMTDIEGFAMYIKTAETARLNLLNPPELTPGEFERVMPYAVALGLENAWGAKFADIAAQMHFSGSLATLDEFQHRLYGGD